MNPAKKLPSTVNSFSTSSSTLKTSLTSCFQSTPFMSHIHDPDSHVLHLFPITDCCKVDEPGQVPHIGGLSHFGTVRRTSAHRMWQFNSTCISSSTKKKWDELQFISNYSSSLPKWIDLGWLSICLMYPFQQCLMLLQHRKLQLSFHILQRTLFVIHREMCQIMCWNEL